MVNYLRNVDNNTNKIMVKCCWLFIDPFTQEQSNPSASAPSQLINGLINIIEFAETVISKKRSIFLLHSSQVN